MEHKIIANNFTNLINKLDCGFQILRPNANKNTNFFFGINRFTGNLFITKNLKLNKKNVFNFQVGILSKCDLPNLISKNKSNASNIEIFLINSSVDLSELNHSIFLPIADVIIEVLDSNDNSVVFDKNCETNLNNTQYECLSDFKISEQLKSDFPIAKLIYFFKLIFTILNFRITAKSSDDLENSQIQYSLLSGDDFGLIKLNQTIGSITFNHWSNEIVDDYFDTFNFTEDLLIKFSVVFLASSNNVLSNFAYKIKKMSIDLNEWSGSAPFYPLSIIHKVVPESTRVGSILLNIAAINKLNIKSRKDWTYLLIQTYPLGKVCFIFLSKIKQFFFVKKNQYNNKFKKGYFICICLF